MGVDYKRYENDYWKILEIKYKEQLNIIPFTSDKEVKDEFYRNIGVNCCTGTYEPFGYTLCEVLDRRIPVIVQNIDGPIEIVDKVKDYVYVYEVDQDIKADIDNFSKALSHFFKVSPEERKQNSELARKALDTFRPENIKCYWEEVLDNVEIVDKSDLHMITPINTLTAY